MHAQHVHVHAKHVDVHVTEVDKQLALSEWSIHERRCAAPAFYFSQLSR